MEHKRFDQLFSGRADCFGVYRVTEVKEGKQKGRGITYPNDRYPERVLEYQDFEKHWRGEQMLGIVPVLLDGTCSWFAIDIDDYKVDHKRLVIDVDRHELPLVTCRSKSGGAHLYCFTSEPIKASLAMELGRKWTTELGYPKAEVFPKQAKFDDEGAKGNWIIVPYYNESKALDFAYSLDGNKLDLEDFELLANARIITPVDISKFASKKAREEIALKNMTEEQILAQSPPCIVQMIKDGIPSSRNNALTHMCAYFQKLDTAFDTDNWKDRLISGNIKYCQEPLLYEELQHIMRSVGRKRYQYQCKIEPQVSLCDREACLKRKFGVGVDNSHYGPMEISGMVKIDSKPPVWIPRINGTDIEMDTDTLLSPRKFRMAVADALNIVVPQEKQKQHDAIIAPIMNDSLTVEAIDELTTIGKILLCFKDWTKNMATKSVSIDDLEKGLPFFEKETECIVFRGSDFIKEYRRIHRDNRTDRDMWAAMRTCGFDRKNRRILKQSRWTWYYNLKQDEETWFTVQAEERF